MLKLWKFPCSNFENPHAQTLKIPILKTLKIHMLKLWKSLCSNFEIPMLELWKSPYSNFENNHARTLKIPMPKLRKSPCSNFENPYVQTLKIPMFKLWKFPHYYFFQARRLLWEGWWLDLVLNNGIRPSRHRYWQEHSGTASVKRIRSHFKLSEGEFVIRYITGLDFRITQLRRVISKIALLLTSWHQCFSNIS